MKKFEFFGAVVTCLVAALFCASAFAGTAVEDGAPKPSLLASVMPLIIIFVMFYFLLIRPQQKKVKAHKEMIEGLKPGVKVVTAGGIIGTVKDVSDKRILKVEVSDGVVVEIAASYVSDLLDPKEQEALKPADKMKEKKARAVGAKLKK